MKQYSHHFRLDYGSSGFKGISNSIISGNLFEQDSEEIRIIIGEGFDAFASEEGFNAIQSISKEETENFVNNIYNKFREMFGVDLKALTK